MRTKRFLSIVLTLAMLVGMFPGMSLTAYAADTTTTITPGTDDAKTGTGTMTITLKIKAAQTITASDVTATYGDTDKAVSASVTEPTTGGGAITYAVKDGSGDYIDVAADGKLTIKKVPASGKAYVIVKAAKTDDYLEATKEVTVTIAKADPTATAPSATATYGQTLSNVTLNNPAGNTAGNWSFKDDGTTSVGNAGDNTFKANFTPTDTTNYNTVSNVNVTVTVGKANPTAVAPSGLTANCGQKLSDVTLTNPEGNTQGTWAWADSSAGVGNVGVHTFKANFTPKDTTNYNTANSIDVTVTVKADKTALNTAISEAETLYNSIKDNADYTDIANTLNTAIETAKTVAQNDTAEQGSVDSAATAIATAKTTAEADKKDVDDTKAANAVKEKINALPESTKIGVSDKVTIEAARKAYDDLTDDQKAKVPAGTLKTLEDAETALAAAEAAAEKEATDSAAAKAVSDMIAELPAKNEVTKANKSAINAAKAAFDKLTADQKAKVSETDKQKLNDAVAAIAAIEKDEADTAAANAVKEKINALPAADKVTTADKAAIEAARKAYDALTKDQQKKVTTDTLKKLTEAEKALAAAEKEASDADTAKAVSDKINALPAADQVITADKAAIEAVRQAYDTLTPDQKAKVSADTLKKLTDDEAALKEAEMKAVKSVTVNAKTVNAKSVKAAVAKAGGSSKDVKTVVIGKNAKKISKGAFKNYKSANTLVVKSKKLKRSAVKKSLKGSKITKVKIKVGSKKTNKKYVKKYKKIFTKKNSGKKVKVSL